MYLLIHLSNDYLCFMFIILVITPVPDGTGTTLYFQTVCFLTVEAPSKNVKGLFVSEKTRITDQLVHPRSLI